MLVDLAQQPPPDQRQTAAGVDLDDGDSVTLRSRVAILRRVPWRYDDGGPMAGLDHLCCHRQRTRPNGRLLAKPEWRNIDNVHRIGSVEISAGQIVDVPAQRRPDIVLKLGRVGQAVALDQLRRIPAVDDHQRHGLSDPGGGADLRRQAVYVPALCADWRSDRHSG